MGITGFYTKYITPARSRQDPSEVMDLAIRRNPENDTAKTDTSGMSLRPDIPDKAVDFTDSAGSLPDSAVPLPDETLTFFAEKDTRVLHEHPSRIAEKNPDWVTGVFMICFIILVWVQVNYRKGLQKIFGAFLSARKFSQFVREGDIRREGIAVALFIGYLLIVPVMILEFISHYMHMPVAYGFLSWLIIAGLVLVGWIVKTAAVWFSGFLFRAQDVARLYNTTGLISNYVLGIMVFPLVIIGVYTGWKPVIPVAMTLTAILLIYRLLRQGVMILESRKFSYFHIFLYLCTLEILPLLVIMKVVIMYNE